MNRLGWATLLLACLAACLVSACVRTSDGVPVAGEGADTTSAPSTPRSTDAAPAAPGVMPTTRAPIPPNTVTCSPEIKPPVTMTAQVADPRAPKITLAILDGWSSSTGSGDVAARLAGPNGMSATVTIAATHTEPAAAFTEYADRLMAESAVSSVSVIPGPLCGYSGQKLMGVWSDIPQNAVEFADRIVHVWTNTGNYLVAVHVQAPTETAGFDAASSLLTDDFEIGIP